MDRRADYPLRVCWVANVIRNLNGLVEFVTGKLVNATGIGSLKSIKMALYGIM